MAQPLPYERDFDFAGFQSTHPSTPLPGDKVNLEFDQVSYTLDEIRARIKILQRDDLQLANTSVGWDQLKPELRNGFSTPTVWAAGVDYAIGAAVYVGRRVYAALVAHRSVNFSVDLAAGKWHLLADFTAVTQVDQSAIEAAQQAIAAATAAQGSALAAAQTVAQSAANAQAALNSANVAAASQTASANNASSASASAANAAASASEAASAATAVIATQKGAPNGLATLGIDGKVPHSQIPLALSSTGDLTQDTSSLYAFGADNGWFLGYDLRGGVSYKFEQSENVMSSGGSGAFRDGLYVQHIDGDTTDYGTPQRRVISNGARVLANGKYTNSGGWESQTKDIVALDAHAIGRITGWDDRGVSGVAAGAIQYGSGIASNEFAAENSVYANEQSTSMAAVQAILRPHKGAADATHKYRAVLASNTQGYEATAAFEAYSAAHPTDPARNGAFKIGLELGGVNATEAGIRMPRTGLNGGLIDYDANDYSRYDRTANRFDFVIGGNFVLSWTSFGVAIGGLASGDARLKIPQSTSAGPHIRLVPGGTPSAPQDGDIWFDGQLRIRIGGVTKTFQLV